MSSWKLFESPAKYKRLFKNIPPDLNRQKNKNKNLKAHMFSSSSESKDKRHHSSYQSIFSKNVKLKSYINTA